MKEKYEEERKYLEGYNIILTPKSLQEYSVEVACLKNAVRELVQVNDSLRKALDQKQQRLDALSGATGKVNIGGNEKLSEEEMASRLHRSRSNAERRVLANQPGYNKGRVQQVGANERSGVHSVSDELDGVPKAGYDSFEAGTIL